MKESMNKILKVKGVGLLIVSLVLFFSIGILVYAATLCPSAVACYKVLSSNTTTINLFSVEKG